MPRAEQSRVEPLRAVPQERGPQELLRFGATASSLSIVNRWRRLPAGKFQLA